MEKTLAGKTRPRGSTRVISGASPPAAGEAKNTKITAAAIARSAKNERQRFMAESAFGCGPRRVLSSHRSARALRAIDRHGGHDSEQGGRIEPRVRLDHFLR